MAIEFKQRVLDNGLTVLAECNEQAHTSALGFFVKTGARDEEPVVMGVSHFLEHMLFKGTARRSADDVNREFDEIGANYNAYTSHEQTVFFAQVLPEYLGRATDLLADILKPALRSDDFEMEKQVILEEIGMYEDRPHWRLQDRLLEVFFERHPLAHRVLGTQQTIEQLTAEQMRAYFDEHYAADNIVVSAAGKVDFERLVDDLAKQTEGWQRKGLARKYDPPELEAHDESLEDEHLSRFYTTVMYPGPSAQDERRYAAKILADIVGDSEGSRIYWALVDPGLAEEADMSFWPQDQAGGFVGFASCDPEHGEEVEAKLIEVIEQVGGGVGGVEAGELERAKNKIATGATLQGENPAGRMRELGTHWQYLNEYSPLERELERIQAVTADDLAELTQAYPFGPRTVVRLRPSG